jgi:hypothetical protein
LWRDLSFLSEYWINDAHVCGILSSDNALGLTSLRLIIIGCPGVDGSGLSPLIHSNILECLRFHDNKSIFLRRSRHLTPGPSLLEILQTTFFHLINGKNLSRRQSIGMCTCSQQEVCDNGPLGEDDRILTCSEGLCRRRGPLQKLHWCCGCRYCLLLMV